MYRMLGLNPVVLFLFGLLIGWCGRAIAASPAEIDSLKGLDGVYILVEDLPKALTDLGATREQLQASIELRLRTLGIKVLTRQEYLASLKSSYLYVQVNCLKVTDSPVYAINYNLQLMQGVKTIKTPETICIAATWSKSKIMIFGVLTLLNDRQSLLDLIDIFANDYLAANPKQVAQAT